MYRIRMETSRCLIPATNYFEWRDGMKPKPKYEIKPADGDMMYRRVCTVKRATDACFQY